LCRWGDFDVLSKEEKEGKREREMRVWSRRYSDGGWLWVGVWWDVYSIIFGYVGGR
jgi:hypothetical protein